MTNKVICVEFLKRWAVANSVHASHVNNIYVVSYEKLKEFIERYGSAPSPAPAEGVISTVTNCPTCGAECTVEGKTTHYYVPRTAPSAQWLPMETAPKDGTYIVLNIPNAAHPLVGNWFSTVSFRNGWWVANTMPVQPTGWLPTPTKNTRE